MWANACFSSWVMHRWQDCVRSPKFSNMFVWSRYKHHHFSTSEYMTFFNLAQIHIRLGGLTNLEFTLSRACCTGLDTIRSGNSRLLGGFGIPFERVNQSLTLYLVSTA